MITKNFLEIIGKIDKKVAKYYWENPTKEELILKKFAKLTEEVWELSSEILAGFWAQRRPKTESHSKEALELEFADVVLTTLLLSKTMNVDINVALEKKLEKLKERGLL